MQGQNNQEDNSVFYVLLSILFLAWLQKKIEIIGMQKIIRMVITIIASISFMLLLYLIAWKINRNRQNKKCPMQLSQDRIIEQFKTEEGLPEDVEQSNTEKEMSESLEQSLTEEVLPKSFETAQRKEVTISLDSEKRLFKCKKLNLDEMKYLMAKGYRISSQFSINSRKKEKLLIKPRFNESEGHAFVVYDICEFLEKKYVECKKYMTTKPDITFEINDKRYAIEVETGNKLSKDKKAISEKVKQLKKEYDTWFFVCTVRKYVQKYRKFGKTIDRRYLRNQLEKILKKA